MKDIWFVVRKLIGTLIFIFALSLLGIGTGKPIMMVAYGAFFIVVMYIIYLFVKNRQRHFEVVKQENYMIKKIVGIVMSVIGVLIPVVLISTVQIFDMTNLKIGIVFYIVTFIITLVLVALSLFAVNMINKKSSTKLNKIVGYIIIVIVSAIPGLCVIPYDQTTTGIGSIYYVALITTVICWWGLSLFLSKK